MIVIHASVLIDPANSDAAVAAAKAMMLESRKEPGCHAYTFARDLSEPGRFWILEEWENDEALAIHFKAPHMAKFQQAVGGLGVKEMKAERFVVLCGVLMRRPSRSPPEPPPVMPAPPAPPVILMPRAKMEPTRPNSLPPILPPHTAEGLRIFRH